MGLTINYDISFKGTAEELLEKIETIRQKCLDLPFEQVTKIEHILYGEKEYKCYRDIENRLMYPNNTKDNMQKASNLYNSMGIDREVLINYDVYHKSKKFRPFSFVKWGVWAGKGCEGTDFNFFKKKTWWKCHSFTKTQYAEQFVKCHLLVIKVLDFFKEQGFVVKVDDEGHYWEKRDFDTLSKEINDYTTMIKSLFGDFSVAAKKEGMTVESPIIEAENYIIIKDKTKKE